MLGIWPHVWVFCGILIKPQSELNPPWEADRPTTEPYPSPTESRTDLAAARRRPEIPVGICRRVRRVGARFVGGDDRAAFVVDAVREGHQRHGQP